MSGHHSLVKKLFPTFSNHGSTPVFSLIVLSLLVVGTLLTLREITSPTKKETRTRAQTVSGCQTLTVSPNKTINGYRTDQFVWFDSLCKPRSAALVNNTVQDPTGRWGGYLQQYAYDLDGTTRTANGGNFWAGGFGYLTNHWGSGATLSVNTQGTFTQAIFSGQNHAIHQFKWRLWMGGPVDATVQWFFATGRDHPVWSVTYDATPAGKDVVYADSRSPYGDIAWDGGAGANVDGVGWGDHFKFKSTQVPVTDRSGWDYSQANTIPYTMEWINSPDAEMGIVQTQTYQQHDAGGYGFFSNWGKTSSGPMPQDFDWTYQLNQYEMGSGPTASKRLAWGMNYSAVGQDLCWKYGDPAGPSGDCYPYQSYSVHVVLDKHSKNPVFNQVAQVENVQKATLTASVGLPVTQGPAGTARTDTITYTPVGYNHIYGTWEVNANSQNQTTFTLNPNGGSLQNPIFIIHNFTNTTIPQAIVVNGEVKTNDIDFFASLDATNRKLWITLNQTVTVSTQIQIGGPTPTPCVGSGCPTPTPTFTPTPSPVPPTSTPTPTPVPPGSITVTFDDIVISGDNQPLTGQYPVGVLSWGSSGWLASTPFAGFSTKNLSLIGGATQGSIGVLQSRVLLSLQATNGGTVASTVTVSCASNPVKTVSVAVGQTPTITTGFTTACTSVTVSSSNGWDTNFDNLTLSAITGSPTATPTLRPTNTPTPTSTARKPGDCNGDTVVNIADLSTVLRDYASTTALTCDFVAPFGEVDIGDLSTILTHFGE